MEKIHGEISWVTSGATLIDYISILGHLDAEKNLLDGDGGAPVLLLVQQGQAH